jgi:hypothetical protein
VTTAEREELAALRKPRIRAALRKEGITCSKKRVVRLMVEHDLVGRCPKRSKTTTIPDPAANAVDLVKRTFTPGTIEVDTILCGDMTPTCAPGRGWA